MALLAYIPPPLVLAIVVASAYAALYNLWHNGSPRDLAFCLAAAWAGFALGQVAGWLLHLDFAMIGSLYLVEGTLLSWLMLLLMNWLRLPAKATASGAVPARKAERKARSRRG
jgi:hypothetical protein